MLEQKSRLPWAGIGIFFLMVAATVELLKQGCRIGELLPSLN